MTAGKPRPLWRISLRAIPEAEDAVAGMLETLFGAGAAAYTDAETGVVTVSVYLEAKPPHFNERVRDLRNQVARGFGSRAAFPVSLKRVRRQDWAESWKRHFHPLQIGRALLVKPSWRRMKPRAGQKVVVLDPGLSFGTGHHPTTAFCLQQIAARRPGAQPRSFLDIGTGSGILAIAAAKLGFRPVHAFDFDPEAVRTARANAQANGAASQIVLRRQDLSKTPPTSKRQYNLVCANLLSTLLIRERDRILARLASDGVIVVAGILKKEFDLVQKTYSRAGLRMVASRTEKEWRSAAFSWR